MLHQAVRRLHTGLWRGPYHVRRSINAGVLARLGFALLIAGSSGAAACSDIERGKITPVTITGFITGEPGRYAYKPDGNPIDHRLQLGTSSRPKDLHFCVDLELPTPSGADAEIGLYFWRNDSNNYTFKTTGRRFSVEHIVFQYPHALVWAAPFPIVDKEAPRMREIEFEARDGGATIKVDGRVLTDFVARPPSGDLSYGLLFRAKDKSTVLRFARPTVFGQ